MVRRTRSGSLVFDDFIRLIGDDQKADLIDGVIYLASPENQDHNQLKLWLSIVVGQYVEQRNLGRVYADKFAYRLTEKTAPEPDLAFVSHERLHRVLNGYMDGAPDLAVEIVSPDSVDRDYEDKRQRYEAAGLREYWIIDPMESTEVFLVRRETGFVEVFPENHVFLSQVLPGFRLDVRWLRQRPLPQTLPIIQRLLA
jgi:Uma2 family endonuclease